MLNMGSLRKRAQSNYLTWKQCSDQCFDLPQLVSPGSAPTDQHFITTPEPGLFKATPSGKAVDEPMASYNKEAKEPAFSSTPRSGSISIETTNIG
ncbi:hypothetical protein CEP52_017819, partial [Fusarium oligoseptatum]